MDQDELEKEDPVACGIIAGEKKREQDSIELIASENFVSKAVLEAQGSVLTNKYAEGYPGHRYYGGCEFVDQAEQLAIDRLKQLFGVSFANVQPHSGSQANMAAIRSVCHYKDRILGMSLDAGGHLTHGYRLSFSGADYDAFSYDTDPITGLLDYDRIRKLAAYIRPKLIICGASAYPRFIDFKEFRSIADDTDALLMADIAHIAGPIAAGLHPTPVGFAHIITSTTHKTLRGPRGGVIMTNDDDLAAKINRSIFPGIQGGPLMHVIVAKAVAFGEDLKPEFKDYIAQVLSNAKALADELTHLGYAIVTGGTDNHMVLVDIKSSTGLTGLEAQNLLERANITTNKNAIPHDTEKPAYASGLRLGTPAMTTRGYREDDFRFVARLLDYVLKSKGAAEAIASARASVAKLNSEHPLPY